MGGFEISPPSDLTTVADAALHGWDLALRCDGCDRCLRWTSADLVRRFRSSLAATLGDIGARMRCAGCGSTTGRMTIVQGAGFGFATTMATKAARLEAILAERDSA